MKHKLYPETPVPGYLTTSQVAELTGWHQETVAHYVKEGVRLKGFKLGSIWMVEIKSLEAYQDSLRSENKEEE